MFHYREHCYRDSDLNRKLHDKNRKKQICFIIEDFCLR